MTVFQLASDADSVTRKQFTEGHAVGISGTQLCFCACSHGEGAVVRRVAPQRSRHGKAASRSEDPLPRAAGERVNGVRHVDH